MSKSLGNFITVRGLLRDWHDRPWHGLAVRHAMLMTHYRQPLDWTEDKLSEASSELKEWAMVLDNHRTNSRTFTDSINNDVLDALCDDLNTPKARSVLQDEFSRRHNWSKLERDSFKNTLEFLGILDPQKIGSLARPVGGENLPRKHAKKILTQAIDYSFHYANNDLEMMRRIEKDLELYRVQLQALENGEIRARVAQFAQEQTIDSMIEARNEARKARKFAEADRIRDELKEMGILLEDSRDPETGEIKTTPKIAR